MPFKSGELELRTPLRQWVPRFFTLNVTDKGAELAYYYSRKEFEIGGGPAEVINLKGSHVTIHDKHTLVPRRLCVITESNELHLRTAGYTDTVDWAAALQSEPEVEVVSEAKGKAMDANITRVRHTAPSPPPLPRALAAASCQRAGSLLGAPTMTSAPLAHRARRSRGRLTTCTTSP